MVEIVHEVEGEGADDEEEETFHQSEIISIKLSSACGHCPCICMEQLGLIMKTMRNGSVPANLSVEDRLLLNDHKYHMSQLYYDTDQGPMSAVPLDEFTILAFIVSYSFCHHKQD